MSAFKPNQSPVVIAFDGEVLELLPGHRYHITQIVKLELNVDKKNRYTLDFDDPFTSWSQPVDAAAVAPANQLVAAVEKARAEFKFE